MLKDISTPRSTQEQLPANLTSDAAYKAFSKPLKDDKESDTSGNEMMDISTESNQEKEVTEQEDNDARSYNSGDFDFMD